MINSTAISASLPKAPVIPPRDLWAATQTYKIFYHLKSSAAAVHTFTLTGIFPHAVLAVNLLKYTEYSFYAYYYGSISSVYEYNLISQTSHLRTDEDGMCLQI